MSDTVIIDSVSEAGSLGVLSDVAFSDTEPTAAVATLFHAKQLLRSSTTCKLEESLPDLVSLMRSRDGHDELSKVIYGLNVKEPLNELVKVVMNPYTSEKSKTEAADMIAWICKDPRCSRIAIKVPAFFTELVQTLAAVSENAEEAEDADDLASARAAQRALVQLGYNEVTSSQVLSTTGGLEPLLRQQLSVLQSIRLDEEHEMALRLIEYLLGKAAARVDTQLVRTTIEVATSFLQLHAEQQDMAVLAANIIKVAAQLPEGFAPTKERKWAAFEATDTVSSLLAVLRSCISTLPDILPTPTTLPDNQSTGLAVLLATLDALHAVVMGYVDHVKVSDPSLVAQVVESVLRCLPIVQQQQTSLGQDGCSSIRLKSGLDMLQLLISSSQELAAELAQGQPFWRLSATAERTVSAVQYLSSLVSQLTQGDALLSVARILYCVATAGSATDLTVDQWAALAHPLVQLLPHPETCSVTASALCDLTASKHLSAVADDQSSHSILTACCVLLADLLLLCRHGNKSPSSVSSILLSNQTLQKLCLNISQDPHTRNLVFDNDLLTCMVALSNHKAVIHAELVHSLAILCQSSPGMMRQYYEELVPLFTDLLIGACLSDYPKVAAEIKRSELQSTCLNVLVLMTQPPSSSSGSSASSSSGSGSSSSTSSGHGSSSIGCNASTNAAIELLVRVSKQHSSRLCDLLATLIIPERPTSVGTEHTAAAQLLCQLLTHEDFANNFSRNHDHWYGRYTALACAVTAASCCLISHPQYALQVTTIAKLVAGCAKRDKRHVLRFSSALSSAVACLLVSVAHFDDLSGHGVLGIRLNMDAGVADDIVVNCIYLLKACKFSINEAVDPASITLSSVIPSPWLGSTAVSSFCDKNNAYLQQTEDSTQPAPCLPITALLLLPCAEGLQTRSRAAVVTYCNQMLEDAFATSQSATGSRDFLHWPDVFEGGHFIQALLYSLAAGSVGPASAAMQGEGERITCTAALLNSLLVLCNLVTTATSARAAAASTVAAMANAHDCCSAKAGPAAFLSIGTGNTAVHEAQTPDSSAYTNPGRQGSRWLDKLVRLGVPLMMMCLLQPATSPLADNMQAMQMALLVLEKLALHCPEEVLTMGLESTSQGALMPTMDALLSSSKVDPTIKQSTCDLLRSLISTTSAEAGILTKLELASNTSLCKTLQSIYHTTLPPSRLRSAVAAALTAAGMDYLLSSQRRPARMSHGCALAQSMARAMLPQ